MISRSLTSHLVLAVSALAASSCALPGATKILGTSSSGTGGAGQTSSTTTTGTMSSSTTTGSTGSGTCQAGRTPDCTPAAVGCQPIPLGPFVGDYGADLALVGDNLYLTTGGHNTVQRVDYMGIFGPTIPAGQNPMRLVSDGTFVYYASYEADSPIVRTNLDLTQPTVVAKLANGEDVGELYMALHKGTSATALYWTTYTPKAIWRVQADGTDQTPHQIIASPLVNTPEGVAVDDAYLYWGDIDGVRRMKVVDIGGSNAVEDFAILSQPQPAHQVALDADNVYWITYLGVRSKAKSGMMGERIYSDNSNDQPVALALDDKSIYWVTAGGVVERADKINATVTKLAEAHPIYSNGIAGIAVDCGAVYWTVNDTSNKNVLLYKAPK